MKNETFSANPNLKAYHKTSDGVKFYRKHDAKTHARSLKDKNIETVDNPDHGKPTVKVDEKKPAVKKSSKKDKSPTAFEAAKLRAESISALESVEAVTEALKDETAKTVIAAGEERIKAIEAAADKK